MFLVCAGVDSDFELKERVGLKKYVFSLCDARLFFQMLSSRFGFVGGKWFG
jgi:hypothetical protein